MKDKTHMTVRIRATLTGVLGVADDRIDDETSPATVEAWDSLQHLNLVLALQEEFGIEFEPEEIAEMLSYSSILDAVDRRIGTEDDAG